MRRTLIVLLIALLSAACTAKPDAAIPSRVLESWQPEEDTLTKSDTMRAWRFNGQQGDEVRLRLAAKASGQVSLALQDDDGKTLAQGGDVNFTLPTDGLYTALVQLVKGSDTTYSLTLSYANQSVPTATITPSDTPTATLTPTPTFTPSDTPTATLTPTPVYSALGTLTGHLEIDQPVDGGYLSAFERHIYLFSGSAGQQVTISMVATSGSVDPTLTLYDPSGQPMATDDNSGGGSAALLRDILLPVDGEYVVQALGGGTGSYRISLQATAPTPDQPTVTPTPLLGTVTPVAGADALSDHVPVVDMIDRHDAFKRYFIDAHAGDILTLSVHPVDGSTLKPRLDIYTPEGELMVSTGLDRSGQAQIPGLGVIEDGRYAVFVTADGRTGGAYILSFGFGSTNSDVLRGALAPETAAAGSRLSATRDEWTLLLSIGDVIDLEAPGAALQVVAPDGSNVVQAGDRAQFNATESGAYRLYASGGRYTLLWHYLIAAPTAQAPVTILSADDPLPAQTYLYYPFQAMSGLHVHIRVEALNDGVDPVAALLDSSGATVATGDDSPGTLNPDFGALLPADGTYMLRVNDYNNAGGSVRVSVQLSS